MIALKIIATIWATITWLVGIGFVSVYMANVYGEVLKFVWSRS